MMCSMVEGGGRARGRDFAGLTIAAARFAARVLASWRHCLWVHGEVSRSPTWLLLRRKRGNTGSMPKPAVCNVIAFWYRVVTPVLQHAGSRGDGARGG